MLYYVYKIFIVFKINIQSVYILISSSFPGSFVWSTHLPLLIRTFTSSSKSILGS